MYPTGPTTISGGIVAGGTLVLTGFSALAYATVALVLVVAGLFLVRAARIK